MEKEANVGRIMWDPSYDGSIWYNLGILRVRNRSAPLEVGAFLTH